jgi:hypothetical protein
MSNLQNSPPRQVATAPKTKCRKTVETIFCDQTQSTQKRRHAEFIRVVKFATLFPRANALHETIRVGHG